MWSLRISIYIFSKKLKNRKEDPRYQEFRNTWKYFYVRSFFQVYMLQGALLLLIAIPLFLINMDPFIPVNSDYIIGAMIALFGLIFETIADIQLKNFLKERKGKEIMKKGLWKYSRHPNYFGESVFWLGISIIVINVSFLAIISWVTITILLRFVSGVPLAERRYKDNKEYIEYQKKTPPMIPNFFIR
jgi:steroid 5-alpha reductase family enzyme